MLQADFLNVVVHPGISVVLQNVVCTYISAHLDITSLTYPAILVTPQRTMKTVKNAPSFWCLVGPGVAETWWDSMFYVPTLQSFAPALCKLM